MSNKRDGIPYDGYGNVLEMLKRSDAQFREKILSNLRKKDPVLARRLEQSLQPTRRQEEEMSFDDSQAALERGKRAAFTRNYGN
jgi:hypothetical protein